MRKPFVLFSVVLAGLAAVIASNPARANCYELFGCTDSQLYDVSHLKQASCQILWEMRNTIYKERGYCFHSQRAIKAFGNAGCLYDDVSSVPLNTYERANVGAIKEAGSSKGC
jgi:YARHG domain